MDNWFYYSSIRSLSLALVDVFTGIRIAKINEDGTTVGMVDVPLNYGLKTKEFYWRNSKTFNQQLPFMALSCTQMQYSSERATQKQGKLYFKNEDKNGKLVEMKNPSPWDISYTLGIASKYVIEAEQILEQILPFFNPFLMLSVEIKELGFSYDAKVILNSVSEDKQSELSEDEVRNISWSIDLTCHGYLFRPVANVGVVKKIVANWYDGKQFMEQEIIDDKTSTISKQNFEETL